MLSLQQQLQLLQLLQLSQLQPNALLAQQQQQVHVDPSYPSSSLENVEEEEATECVICQDSLATAGFVHEDRSMHQICCPKCAEDWVVKQGKSTCPKCNKTIITW